MGLAKFYRSIIVIFLSCCVVSTLSPEELDNILVKCDSGMDLALKRAKAWSKYAKDIITYVEKRATLGKQ